MNSVTTTNHISKIPHTGVDFIQMLKKSENTDDATLKHSLKKENENNSVVVSRDKGG